MMEHKRLNSGILAFTSYPCLIPGAGLSQSGALETELERFPMIRFLTIISLIMFTIPADVTADTGSGPTAGRTITVRGQTSVAAVPDRAELTDGHTNRAETAAKAMAANNAAMETVFTALKALGIAERDMRTAGFSVAPVMARADRNSPPRIVAYGVSNRVAVTLRDRALLGAMLDVLTRAGAKRLAMPAARRLSMPIARASRLAGS